MVCCLHISGSAFSQPAYWFPTVTLHVATFHLVYALPKITFPFFSPLPQCTINMVLVCHQHCSACLSSGCHAQPHDWCTMELCPWPLSGCPLHCAHGASLLQCCHNIVWFLRAILPATDKSQPNQASTWAVRMAYDNWCTWHGGYMHAHQVLNKACKGLQIMLRVFWRLRVPPYMVLTGAPSWNAVRHKAPVHHLTPGAAS